jgi:septum formation protein
MMIFPYPLVLASASPRRSQLLRDAGFDFQVRCHEIQETWPEGLEPESIPAYLAGKKAAAVQQAGNREEVILAADTLVFLGKEIIGKPADDHDAIRILTRLSGHMHRVITGVVLLGADHRVIFSDTTEVYFKKLDPDDIRYYVDRYHPLDKAGAYAIQEWIGLAGVEKIHGDFFNVMGLPVHRVIEALRSWKK